MNGIITDSASGLPVHRVHVVEPGDTPRPDHLKCEIGNNLKFDTARLQAYCFANWTPLVFDAFLLAAAVQFCDHTRARRPTRWGRHFMLCIPVHDLEHWSSAMVSRSLQETLEFLTGDRWHLEFVGRKKPQPDPAQRNLEMPDSGCVIVPFSNGMDSWAAATLAKRMHGRNPILVRLGRRSLQDPYAKNQRNAFASVPYSVHYGPRGSAESSARSRGLKFMLLSGVAAYLSRARQVIVPESGQGALGPVLVPVGQAYEDYRNHPLFTDRMAALMSALFDHEIHYAHPYLWQTKAETVAKADAESLDDENWLQTRSCWQGPRWMSVAKQWRQCGVCAACMLRRMSVHAVGLSESKETYVWENLKAAHYQDGAVPGYRKNDAKGAQYEYAVAGTLHMTHLADLLHSTANRVPVNLQVRRLSRSLEIPEQETRQKLKRLLTQHAKEWNDFVGSLGARSFVARWTSGRP